MDVSLLTKTLSVIVALTQASLSDDSEVFTMPVISYENSTLDQLQVDIRPKTGKGSQGAKLPEDLGAERFGRYEAAVVDNQGDQRTWAHSTFVWAAPSFYHRPLYFEQINLERYGHFHRSWHIESAMSTAHFFSVIPTLPYRIGADHLCKRIYTRTHLRPGDCNPHYKYRIPKSKDGMFWQGIATTGLLFAI